jgi:hypothetical protein
MESSGAQRKTRETNSCTIRRTVTRQSSKQPRWERAGNLWREGRARTEGGAEAADEGEGERHQHVRLHFRRGSALLPARVWGSEEREWGRRATAREI